MDARLKASVALALALGAAGCAWGQADVYRPYRYVERWHADTLYLGASFRYKGGGDIRISIEFSETSTNGKLFVIHPPSGRQAFVMTNREPAGTVVNVSRLLPFAPGDEVVFMYVADIDGNPRYSGPSRPGSRYANRLSSDQNVNPGLRFGSRMNVAGKLPGNRVEFGFEDTAGSLFNYADMDFNDIHFHATNLDLLVDMRAAKSRSYVW